MPPPTKKIDSLQTEITKIDSILETNKVTYEKKCSTISNQSFAADTLFFTDYLTRFKLRYNSRTTEAN